MTSLPGHELNSWNIEWPQHTQGSSALTDIGFEKDEQKRDHAKSYNTGYFSGSPIQVNKQGLTLVIWGDVVLFLWYSNVDKGGT